MKAYISAILFLLLVSVGVAIDVDAEEPIVGT
jgi:hypothetical protein